MSTATLTALQAHQQIEEFAKQAPNEMRFIPDGTMTEGKWIRQGDIYIMAIGKVPLEYDEETTNRQLAPGENRGSRHIVHGNNLKLFVNPKNRDPLLGPIVVSKERVEVQHPEHAHFSLPPGTYQVYYQMDARQAERTRSLD